MNTLYALDTKGRIKQWRIWTEGNIIVTEFGLLEGKKQVDRVEAKPKNIGKANATTAQEQALLEAKAKHTKQLDKGYSPVMPCLACLNASTNISPMLAKDYRKAYRAISYHCFIQPKLDGVRALIYTEQDSIKYKSRGNKLYPNIEAIDKELSLIFEAFPKLILDGELYCHEMPLQDIVSSVKKHNENTGHIMFHIFDVAVPDKTWLEREYTVRQIGQIIEDRGLKRIKAVEAHLVASEDEMLEKHSQYIQEGYEGIMLRNYEGFYMFGQRSKDLQKYKTFMDDEFKIIDMELDKYKHGVALLATSQGKTFKAKLAGTDKQRTEMWLLRDQYIGQYATIKYQSLTNDGIPQFPVLISIREMGAGGPMY